MACLTLVRPAWMDDDAASDWVAVAVSRLSDLTGADVIRGARAASNSCTHHGQIVPAIRNATESVREERRRADALCWDASCHMGGKALPDRRSGGQAIGQQMAQLIEALEVPSE